MRLWKGDMQSSCWVNVNRRHTHANTNLGRVNYCLGKERETKLCRWKAERWDGNPLFRGRSLPWEHERSKQKMNWRKLIRGARNIWGFRRMKCKEKKWLWDHRKQQWRFGPANSSCVLVISLSVALCDYLASYGNISGGFFGSWTRCSTQKPKNNGCWVKRTGET